MIIVVMFLCCVAGIALADRRASLRVLLLSHVVVFSLVAFALALPKFTSDPLDCLAVWMAASMEFGITIVVLCLVPMAVCHRLALRVIRRAQTRPS